MSTFARRFDVVVDGTQYLLTSRPGDFLEAERALAREKINNAAETAPLQLQMRIVYAMFRRSNPDNPVAADWAKFLDACEDVTDLDAEVNPLTPTPPAATENSP